MKPFHKPSRTNVAAASETHPRATARDKHIINAPNAIDTPGKEQAPLFATSARQSFSFPKPRSSADWIVAGIGVVTVLSGMRGRFASTELAVVCDPFVTTVFVLALTLGSEVRFCMSSTWAGVIDFTTLLSTRRRLTVPGNGIPSNFLLHRPRI